MRIVFYTRAGFDRDPLFCYLFGRVAERFEDVGIVACRTSDSRVSWVGRVQSGFRKAKRLGFPAVLEILSSYPIAWMINRVDGQMTKTGLEALSHGAPSPKQPEVRWVRTLNGKDASETLREMEPDVIIQSGAGILRPQIFNCARIGTLNMHHGIAPLIRGMSSIYWALWHGRPEWVGTTIHWINEGIDTGEVLAYFPVDRRPGEGQPSLFVRATEGGADRMLEVLERLERGERWKIPPADGERVYRSTISGWRMLMVKTRIAAESWRAPHEEKEAATRSPDSRNERAARGAGS